MSIDTGRERIDEGKRRRAVDRLTPAAKPAQAGELLAPSGSRESTDQSQPSERNEPGGPKENARTETPGLSLLPPGLRRLRYYGLALLFVAIAALLRWALPEVLRPAPALAFYLAWVGAAAFGGLGPGLLATLASWLCIELLFHFTPGHLGFSDPMSMARLWVFLAGGLVVSIVGEKMRRSRIHERRQGRELAAANAALQASEEKYRVVADNTYDWEFWLDPERRFLYLSPSCERITGYAAHEFMDHPGLLQEIIHPEDLPAFLEHQREAPSDRHGDIEFRIITRQGEIRWIHHLCQPIYDKDGQYAGCRGSNRDITARKQAEEALRASQESLALAQKIVHLGNWSWDIKTNEQEWSDESSRIFGFEPGECRPSRDLYVELLHPEDRERFFACWKDALERNVPFGLDYHIIRRDGSVRHVHSEGQIVRDDAGQPVRVFGTNQDITALKQAEQDLRESRDRYQALIETTGDFIWEMDASGKYTYCSPQMRDLWGYEPKDMMGKSPFDVMPPEDREQAIGTFMSLTESHQPFTGLEVSSHDSQGRSVTAEISGVPFFDADGRFLGYRGIARDITARKQAEDALAESRKRYRGLVEEINDWVWEVDANGVYTYASPRALELLGYAPEEIVGKTPFDLMPPAETQRVWNAFEPIWREHKPLELLENTLVRKDGRLVTVETSGMPMFAEDGSFRGYMGVDRDVTARKWAEEQLRRSEEDLNRAQAVAQTGSWRVDVRRNELLWSKETYRIFGTPTGTPMTYETFLASVHPADREYVDGQWTAALRGEPYDIEHRIVIDGQVKWVRERAELEFDEEGTLRAGFGTVQDITARKQVERDLRESRDRYQALIETTADFIWEMDHAGKYTYCSPQMKSLWGYEPQDMIGKTPFDVMPPEDRTQAIESFMSLAKSPKPFMGLEASSYDSQGRLIAVEISGVPFFDADGRLLGYRGISRDVTARQRAEEALRASQNMLQSVMENVPQGIFWKDRHSTYLGCNKVFVKAVGLESARDVIGKTDYDLPWSPEQTASFREYDRRIMENDAPEYHIIEQMRETDGILTWVETNKAPLHDAQGHVIGILGTYEDITERKQAEEALRKSEEKFAKAFRSSPIAIAVTRLRDGRILDANEAMLKLLHFTADEVVGHSTRDLDIWVDVNDRARFTQMLSTAGSVRDLEYRLRTKDGAIVTVHLSAELLEFSGEPCMLSTLVDVTERQRAEEALRQEKIFTDRLLNAPFDTVFVFEPVTGRPVRWNRRFAEVSGYDDEEIAGMRAPDDFYDEEDLKKAKEYTGKILAEGQGVVVLSLITKQGVHIPFEYAATVVEAEGGKTLLLSIGRDITERQRAEEALREWNATLESRVAERTEDLEQRARQLQKLTLELTEAEERERKRLAEILHDDLQQVLAAAKFQVGLLGSRLKNDAGAQEVAGQAKSLLVEAIAKSRSLSHELRAPALSQGDLCEAFEWLAEQMQHKHGLTVQLEAGEPIEPASEPLRLLLYKAAQELLFNVVKHGGVHEAKVRLRHQRGCFRLTVADRGRGFDPARPGFTPGFGLRSIQERVGFLGGRLRIKSAPGRGSIFALAVPDTEGQEGR